MDDSVKIFEDDMLFTEREVAKKTSISTQTLRNWRVRAQGPAYLKIGKFKPPKEFLPFVDSSFTEIQNRGCDYLIIDVTEGGGFSSLTDSLLSYFSEQPYCELEKKRIKTGKTLIYNYRYWIKGFLERDSPFLMSYKELRENIPFI